MHYCLSTDESPPHAHAGFLARHLAGVRRIAFPDLPRSFRGRRELKIVVRSLHVLMVTIFAGGTILGAEVEQRWLIGALTSGLFLLLLDLHESAAFLLQIRGLVVLAKLTALMALSLLASGQTWCLAGLIVVSVVSSHAPSKVRYLMIFGDLGIQGARSKG